MFGHIFKYRLKYMLGSKMSLFWMFIFPILLSLLYFFVFTNLGDNTIQRFPTAVTGVDEALIASMDESGLFEITYADSFEEADKLLKDGKVKGIISGGEQYLLTVTDTGLDEGIVKFFLDSYISVNACITDAFTQETITFQDLAKLDLTKTYTREANVNNNLDTTVIYFYALIGMTAIMGGTIAIDVINLCQANQSEYAARLAVAPVKKSKMFAVSIISSVLFHFMTSLITLLFINVVLGVDFGTRMPEIILLCFVACFTGIMLGAFVSSLIKKKEGVKVAIILSYTLFGSFLSGMMSLDIKYLVAEYLPFLQYINPTNLVTDALYALYYYPGSERYLLNLSILLVFGIAGLIGTGAILRRQQYASI